MARIKFYGLRYFPIDTDVFDEKLVRRLRCQFGNDGMTYYIYCLCRIFKFEGYFLKCDSDFIENASLDMGIDSRKLTQMTEFMVEKGIFDRELYRREQLLTSLDLQLQFQEAWRGSRRTIVVDRSLWLPDEDQTLKLIHFKDEPHGGELPVRPSSGEAPLDKEPPSAPQPKEPISRPEEPISRPEEPISRPEEAPWLEPNVPDEELFAMPEPEKPPESRFTPDEIDYVNKNVVHCKNVLTKETKQNENKGNKTKGNETTGNETTGNETKRNNSFSSSQSINNYTAKKEKKELARGVPEKEWRKKLPFLNDEQFKELENGNASTIERMIVAELEEINIINAYTLEDYAHSRNISLPPIETLRERVRNKTRWSWLDGL